MVLNTPKIPDADKYTKWIHHHRLLILLIIDFLDFVDIYGILEEMMFEYLLELLGFLGFLGFRWNIRDFRRKDVWVPFGATWNLPSDYATIVCFLLDRDEHWLIPMTSPSSLYFKDEIIEINQTFLLKTLIFQQNTRNPRNPSNSKR